MCPMASRVQNFSLDHVFISFLVANWKWNGQFDSNASCFFQFASYSYFRFGRETLHCFIGIQKLFFLFFYDWTITLCSLLFLMILFWFYIFLPSFCNALLLWRVLLSSRMFFSCNVLLASRVFFLVVCYYRQGYFLLAINYYYQGHVILAIHYYHQGNFLLAMCYYH